MAFIEVNLDEVQEDKPVEEGPYTLRIVDVEGKKSKNSGADMLVIQHEIDGYPDSPLVYHNIVFPKSDDEKKTIKFKNLNLKRYLAMAGIPYEGGGFNTDDLLGATFEANLKVVTNEDTGQERNEIVMERLQE